MGIRTTWNKTNVGPELCKVSPSWSPVAGSHRKWVPRWFILATKLEPMTKYLKVGFLGLDPFLWIMPNNPPCHNFLTSAAYHHIRTHHTLVSTPYCKHATSKTAQTLRVGLLGHDLPEWIRRCWLYRHYSTLLGQWTTHGATHFHYCLASPMDANSMDIVKHNQGLWQGPHRSIMFTCAVDYSRSVLLPTWKYR
jgi:hypothetical protein